MEIVSPVSLAIVYMFSLVEGTIVPFGSQMPTALAIDSLSDVNE